MKSRIIELFKSLAGALEYRLRPWNYSSDELVVLCMHSTPKHMMPAFDTLLDFLQRHFKVLSPHQLEAYFKGELNQGPYILFTFDDGLRNNWHVANALHERGHDAYFFIVPDFVRAMDQEAYYRSAIRQSTKSIFDRHAEDVLPLDESQLMQLLAQGHAIGSHSMSHTMRATDSAEKTLREVDQCKSELALLVSQDIDAFCSIVNTNLSVSKHGKALINQHYRYHFTTFPGLNGNSKDAKLIFRRNIELDWSMGMIKYALGKADLSRWTGGIEQFRQL
jgi:peptidoglycan/xylan/chitin deacetylase (PgdA/CDA1 family)